MSLAIRTNCLLVQIPLHGFSLVLITHIISVEGFHRSPIYMYLLFNILSDLYLFPEMYGIITYRASFVNLDM